MSRRQACERQACERQAAREYTPHRLSRPALSSVREHPPSASDPDRNRCHLTATALKATLPEKPPPLNLPPSYSPNPFLPLFLAPLLQAPPPPLSLRVPPLRASPAPPIASPPLPSLLHLPKSLPPPLRATHHAPQPHFHTPSPSLPTSPTQPPRPRVPQAHVIVFARGVSPARRASAACRTLVSLLRRLAGGRRLARPHARRGQRGGGGTAGLCPLRDRKVADRQVEGCIG